MDLMTPSARASVLLGAALFIGAAVPAMAQDAVSGDAADSAAEMSGTMERADADMARVLEALMALEPQPIPELTPEEARQQPTPADAVMRVIEEDGIDVPAPAVTREDITYPAAEGEQPARVYIPTDAGEGPFPLVV